MVDSITDVKSIFGNALAIASPADRVAYLDQACAGNATLRAEVEALLEASADAGQFLDPPPRRSVATVDEPPRTESPGAVIGPYKLIEPIGEGGMGMVWMAQQTEPVKRVVALKLIKAGMDSKQVIARFEAERQALALMDHPNIAKVLDGGTTGAGRPYFVMDLVKGVPITRYCDEHRLPPRERLELFLPVCQAVQHAHQKGIIHRDLKPSNVLVALYDGMPVPKVIDFGVAKAAGQPLTDKTLVTGFGNIVGTLEYMSPEQAEINQLDIDTRSDIYSLGVLLYELLTGSPPFSRKELEKAGVLEMLRVIREQEPSKPSIKLSTSEGLPTLAANRGTEPAKLTKLVRGELDWIVMKALEKDRNRRYETANGFAMDVQRYLADEAVQACPPSVGYRLRKFARRNKGALATVGLLGVMLLVAVGAVAATIGWAARDREALRQEVAKDQAARQAAQEQELTRALQEVETLYRQDRLPQAQAAVRHAERLVTSTQVGEELKLRLRRWRQVLDLLARLEGICLAWQWPAPEVKEGPAEALRDYGIDLDALNQEEAARRIQASGVSDRLVPLLDHWAMTKTASERPGKEKLLAVARLADPDPWRNRLRDGFQHRDRETLKRMAQSPEVQAQSPATLLLLGNGLRAVQEEALALELLRRLQCRHPDNFWITLNAALISSAAGKPEDYSGFLGAAVVLRPQDAQLHSLFGHALESQGRLKEAEVEFREVLRLKPGYGYARGFVDSLRIGEGKIAEVEAKYREDVLQRPQDAQAHYALAKFLDWHKRRLVDAILLSPAWAKLVSDYRHPYNKS